MADTASLVSSMQRPSSWPVRSQRRHAAMADFNNRVLGSLSRIEAAMVSDYVSSPPGLTTSSAPDGKTVAALDQRMQNIEVLLHDLVCLTQDVHQSTALLSIEETRQRLDRLEAFFVCSAPSVDDVL